MFKMVITLGSQAQRLPFCVLKPCRTSTFRWPHRVLKRCTCRASTLKMAVQGSQALRLPRVNL